MKLLIKVIYASLITFAVSWNMVLKAAPLKIEEATIADVHRAMKGGHLTAHQLVQAYLDRIAAFDKKGPGFNAILQINPRALEDADRLDAALRKSGLKGPLHGIPLFIKDAIATNDMPTTGGSLSLKGFVPKHEATVISRLKAAGAIIMGKTNLDEFTFGTRGLSSLGGQTLNPYDLTRSPAGSSGGSAAAVASNFAMAALGTDTGSSIRFPASATSLVGLRPTVGLISRTGIMPNSMTQDTAGPLARTVTDAARLLDVLAGYDPSDSATAWSVGHVAKSYSSGLASSKLKGARIGILKSFFGTGPDASDVNTAMATAITALQGQGVEVITLEDAYDINEIAESQVASYETTHYFDDFLNREGAPVASLSAILASGQFAAPVGDSIKSRVNLSMNDPEFRTRMFKRTQLQERVLKMMADHRLEAVIYPFSRSIVGKVGGQQARHNGFLSAVTGFPALVLPAGFSKPDADAPLGVPIGLEMLGRPWSEARLLQLGYAFERNTKVRRSPASAPLTGPNR